MGDLLKFPEKDSRLLVNEIHCSSCDGPMMVCNIYESDELVAVCWSCDEFHRLDSLVENLSEGGEDFE